LSGDLEVTVSDLWLTIAIAIFVNFETTSQDTFLMCEKTEVISALDRSFDKTLSSIIDY